MEGTGIPMTASRGRTAALHIAFWQYDPWYRRAWFVWPQATAILLAGWLLVGPEAQFNRAIGQSLPIAPTPRPRAARQPGAPCFPGTMRSAGPRSPIRSRSTSTGRPFEILPRTTRPKLSAALGAYYRYDWVEGDRHPEIGDRKRSQRSVRHRARPADSKFDRPGARRARRLACAGGCRGHRQAGSVLGRDPLRGRRRLAEG